MRIRYWSSDVCSSDLRDRRRRKRCRQCGRPDQPAERGGARVRQRHAELRHDGDRHSMQLKTDPLHEDAQAAEGRYGDDLSARLAEFDRDGTLVPDMHALWEILKDHVVDISRAFWEHYCQSPEIG